MGLWVCGSIVPEEAFRTADRRFRYGSTERCRFVWDFPTWPACFFEHRLAALIVTFAVGAGLFPESRLAEVLPTSESAQFRN